MPYNHIIQLIDAQLDRLQTARELLVTHSSAVQQAMPRQQRRVRASATLVVPTTKAEVPAAREVEPSSPEPAPADFAPRTIPARKPRIARAPRRKAQMQETALSRKAPETPVFVSADQVKRIQEEKRAAAGFQEASDAVPETLTVEMLARKWMQSSAS